MNKETGGPAFPTEAYDLDRKVCVREEGMTLRDYFAAKAMQGLVADRRHVVGMGLPSKEKQYAESAYDIADSMLAERAK